MTKHSRISAAAGAFIALTLVGCEDPSSKPIAAQPTGSQAHTPAAQPAPGTAPAPLPDGQPAPAPEPHRPAPGK
jgi:hypothetical protein